MADRWEHSDRVSVTHPGWPLLRGWAKVAGSWDAIFRNTGYIQFVLTDTQVRISGDQAILTCSENIITAVEESANALTSGGSVVTTNALPSCPCPNNLRANPKTAIRSAW